MEEILLTNPPKTSPLIRLLLRSYSSSSCCHRGKNGRDIFTPKDVEGDAAVSCCCFRKGKPDDPAFRADKDSLKNKNACH